MSMPGKNPGQHEEQMDMVRAEMVRTAFSHIPMGTASTLPNIAAVTYVSWSNVPASYLLFWFCYMVTSIFAVFIMWLRFRKQEYSDQELVSWEKRFTVVTALLGIGWGLSAVLFYPLLEGLDVAILLIILAGITAGGAASISTISFSYILFDIFILVPLVIMALLPPANFVIAFITLLYMLFMLHTAKRFENTIYTAFKLRFENVELLDDLSEEVKQRNTIEVRLREKERSLENAQRIANLGNWEWYPNDDIMMLSRQMAKIIGLDESGLIIDHESYISCVNEADQAMLRKVRDDSVKERVPYHCEYRVKTKNDEERYLEEHGEVNQDVMGLRVSAAVLDITERKNIDRMKSEFISMVSHELRTPLTSISGSLGLLQGGIAGNFTAKAENLIETANRNSMRLVNLVNHILDINKVEFSDLPLELDEIDIVELVKMSLRENQGYAESLSVTLHLLEPEPVCRVKGDQQRLIQVMTNLLSNASKYSPEGGVVNVSINMQGNHVLVTVKDSGPGIAEDFKHRVFQKFSQGNTSDSRYQYGTGLGLSISKIIIEKHDGEIGFHSEPGEGSSFYFCLPCVA